MIRLAVGCIVVGLATVFGSGSEVSGSSAGARLFFFAFLTTLFLSCIHGSAGRRLARTRSPEN